MRKKINYENKRISARVIADFLPAPKKILTKSKHVKVTLTLTQRSVNYFKSEAKKHRDSYQAMIRKLVDYYVVRQ